MAGSQTRDSHQFNFINLSSESALLSDLGSAGKDYLELMKLLRDFVRQIEDTDSRRALANLPDNLEIQFLRAIDGINQAIWIAQHLGEEASASVISGIFTLQPSQYGHLTKLLSEKYGSEKVEALSRLFRVMKQITESLRSQKPLLQSDIECLLDSYEQGLLARRDLIWARHAIQVFARQVAGNTAILQANRDSAEYSLFLDRYIKFLVAEIVTLNGQGFDDLILSITNIGLSQRNPALTAAPNELQSRFITALQDLHRALWIAACLGKEFHQTFIRALAALPPGQDRGPVWQLAEQHGVERIDSLAKIYRALHHGQTASAGRQPINQKDIEYLLESFENNGLDQTLVEQYWEAFNRFLYQLELEREVLNANQDSEVRALFSKRCINFIQEAGRRGGASEEDINFEVEKFKRLFKRNLNRK